MVKNRRLGRTEAGYEELTSYIVMSAIGPEVRLVSFNSKNKKSEVRIRGGVPEVLSCGGHFRQQNT